MRIAGGPQAGRRDRGAAAVEFVLLVPGLVMLLFGIISFGFVFATLLGANNAAREAARFGVVDQRTCADIAGQVQTSLNSTIGVTWPVTMNVTRGSTTVCGGVVIPSSGGAGGSSTRACAGSNTSTDALTVSISTSSKWGLWIPFFKKTGFPITGKGVFRCEYS